VIDDEESGRASGPLVSTAPDMTGARRASARVEADVRRTSLLMWIRAAEVLALVAGVGAACIGVALLARGRRLEGLTIGLFGTTAAVTTRAVVGYLAWRIQVTWEREGRRTDVDGSGIP